MRGWLSLVALAWSSPHLERLAYDYKSQPDDTCWPQAGLHQFPISPTSFYDVRAQIIVKLDPS